MKTSVSVMRLKRKKIEVYRKQFTCIGGKRNGYLLLIELYLKIKGNYKVGSLEKK